MTGRPVVICRHIVAVLPEIEADRRRLALLSLVSLFFFCCWLVDEALLLHGYTLTSMWASRRELISLAGLTHRDPPAEAEEAAVEAEAPTAE